MKRMFSLFTCVFNHTNIFDIGYSTTILMHQRCMMPVLFSLILSTVFNWNTKFVKPSLNKQETTHCEHYVTTQLFNCIGNYQIDMFVLLRSAVDISTDFGPHFLLQLQFRSYKIVININNIYIDMPARPYSRYV